MIRPAGPVNADIMVVGEAPGEEEAKLGVPFVGASGQELRRMLKQAGIDPNRVRYTNVFMSRPPNNDVKLFTGKRADVPKVYPYPPLAMGQYVLEKHLPELSRLRDELDACQPKLVIPVGNTACWALLARTGISRLRGAAFPSTLVEGLTCIPTYHPAAVLRDWSLRVVAVTDFLKCRRFVDEGFHLPRRELWLEPTWDEMEAFRRKYLIGNARTTFDIETKAGGITCIGFSPGRECSITVPFFDPRKPGNNYWATPGEELRAWLWCKNLLENDTPKLGQNGLYDIQYLFRAPIPIEVKGYLHDSMIRHHARYPEMEKGLGFPRNDLHRRATLEASAEAEQGQLQTG